jgi:hypothetical protein
MHDRVQEIEQLFLKQLSNVLSPRDRDALRVAIRISEDFGDYLKKREGRDDYPSDDEWDTSYVIGTLRSGIDFLFELRQLNAVLSEGIAAQVNPREAATFGQFRRIYMNTAEHLGKKDISVQFRLSQLLLLGKLEILFIGFCIGGIDVGRAGP